MSDQTETYIVDTVKAEGFTLAQLCWQMYRRQPVGYVERVQALNRELSEEVHIPVGTEIKFPMDGVEQGNEEEQQVVRLWD